MTPWCFVFFFKWAFNEWTAASGETVAAWELTVVGFSYTPVFKSNRNITPMLDPKCTFFLLCVKTLSLHLSVSENLFPLSTRISAQIRVCSRWVPFYLAPASDSENTRARSVFQLCFVHSLRCFSSLPFYLHAVWIIKSDRLDNHEALSIIHKHHLRDSQSSAFIS